MKLTHIFRFISGVHICTRIQTHSHTPQSIKKLISSSSLPLLFQLHLGLYFSECKSENLIQINEKKGKRSDFCFELNGNQPTELYSKLVFVLSLSLRRQLVNGNVFARKEQQLLFYRISELLLIKW